MKIKLASHIKQHAGDILLECQDSFNYNLNNLSFSVSDGVSQAYRPELWSRILTEAFISSPDTFFIKDQNNNFVLNPELGLSGKWAAAEKAAYQNATPQEQFVLDMKKNAINIGAATFIGVKLVGDGIRYQTIGDSVLFFFDYETKELKAYSSMMPESGDMVFNNNPEYIDSNECNHGNIISGILPYRKGILFMATDALSDWIAERRESSDVIENILKGLMSIPTHEAYDTFVDCARNDANLTKLKDDDTTFIALEFLDTDDSYPEIEHSFTEKFDDLLKNNLISELNNLRYELDEIKSAKLKSELAFRGKDKQIDSLTTDLGFCRADIADKKNQILKLDNNIQSLTAKLNKLTNDVNRSDLECTQLKITNSTLTKENNTLKGNISTLQKEISNHKRKIQELEALLNSPKPLSVPTPSTEKDEVIAMKNKLNQSQAREQKLKSELESLKNHVLNAKTLFEKNNGELTLIDLVTLFTNILGEPVVAENYINIIEFGKPTGDGGFQVQK